MEVIRTSNPDAAFALLPFYVPDNQTREQIAEELFARLCNAPDDTLLVVGRENNKIKFMSISYVHDDEVFCWQAYHDKTVSRKWVDLVFGMIQGWAKVKNKKRITAIPNRNPKLWKRRWGFDIAEDNSVYKEIQ